MQRPDWDADLLHTVSLGLGRLSFIARPAMSEVLGGGWVGNVTIQEPRQLPTAPDNGFSNSSSPSDPITTFTLLHTLAFCEVIRTRYYPLAPTVIAREQLRSSSSSSSRRPIAISCCYTTLCCVILICLLPFLISQDRSNYFLLEVSPAEHATVSWFAPRKYAAPLQG